jgi:hypothetical protein
MTGLSKEKRKGGAHTAKIISTTGLARLNFYYGSIKKQQKN